jgi:hypothetical protein
MQPDAMGLAFATSVLVIVVAAFGLASRLISGAVAGLSYAIGLAVARGIAEWAAPEPDPLSVSTGGPDGLDGVDALPPGSGDDADRVDRGVPDTPSVRLGRVVGGRPRLRLECGPAR